MNPLSGINANDGDILVYNSATGKFEPQAPSSGGGDYAKMDFAQVGWSTHGNSAHVSLDNVVFDNNGLADASTGTITIKKNGIYLAVAHAYVYRDATQSAWRIQINKSGSTSEYIYSNMRAKYFSSGGSDYVHLNVSGVLNCQAGDTINLWVIQEDGLQPFYIYKGNQTNLAVVQLA